MFGDLLDWFPLDHVSIECWDEALKYVCHLFANFVVEISACLLVIFGHALHLVWLKVVEAEISNDFLV